MRRGRATSGAATAATGDAPPPPPPPGAAPAGGPTGAPPPPPPPFAPPADAAATVLEARKVYGAGDAEVRALDGVTLSFTRQRFTAVMGPSGSGKSTLLQCAAGLDRLTSGEVFLGEQPLSRLSEHQLTLLRRQQLGFVFQAFNLLPALTARANIELPCKLAGTTPDAAWFERVVGTLGLDERLAFRPSQLSGGQQQRVAVARALVTGPQLVFADEPTGALDSHTSAELLGLLRSVVDDLGQTVVMVTHDPRAAAVADRVVLLVDGRVADDLDHPDAPALIDRLKDLGA